jgi:hypothetical protein
MSTTTETTTSAALDDTTLVKTTATAIIGAPIEAVDIPDWCFGLSDAEYQACSPAHYAAGATTAPDGRRMSINVEMIGGSLIIEHYIEEVAERDHLRLVSRSDLFTPVGRTKINVVWDLRVRTVDDMTCELTNSVQSSATPELLEFLAKQGLPFDAFRTSRQASTIAHNLQETPRFAKSIERHASARP